MDKNEKIRLIVERIRLLIDYVQTQQRNQLVSLIYSQLSDLLEDIL